MCGICGAKFDNGIEGNIGAILERMAESQQIRAQDSAGFTIYAQKRKQRTLVNIIREVDNGYKDLAVDNDNGHNDNNGREISGKEIRYVLEQLKINDTEKERVLADLIANPDIYIASIGNYMGIFKALGLARDVADTYSLRKRRGTHGNAHIRIATAGAVNPYNAHPFGTYIYPDLSVVHNGEITNFGKLRRLLELRGHSFQSTCDSELIAVYIADQLLRHDDLEKALYAFVYGEENGMPAADGPFTFVLTTADALAVVRDKFGLRKAMVGKAPETSSQPSFIAIATDVSALNQVGAIYDRHAPKPGKPEIYWKKV